MVIDTSALLALLFREPEAPRILEAILSTDRRLLAAPTLVEATAVTRARRGPAGVVALNALLHELDIEVAPGSVHAARFAVEAFDRFGKGIGSPGVLNFGDCLAYGVACELREPLLFKGDDFTQTDVEVAPY